MTKHVIALKGEYDSGKTQTLLNLINKLYEATSQNKRVVDNYNHKDCVDEKVAIEYKGIKIAICTGGDNEDVLDKNIAFFKNCDWDIAISATRSKGNTINTIEEFAEEEDAQFHTVQKGWVDNPSSSDNPRQQEACDLLIESTAQVMKIIIDGWIDTMINEK